MKILQQGDIVTFNYPFDDFSGDKIRPAIIVGKSRSKIGAYIVAKVSSVIRNDAQSFALNNAFLSVPTRQLSEVRCNELVTVSETKFLRHVSTLDKTELTKLCQQIQLNFEVKQKTPQYKRQKPLFHDEIAAFGHLY